MNVQLLKFDIKKIKNNDNILITGKSNIGKTSLVKKILHNFKDIQNGIIFSPSNFYNKKYEDMVSSTITIHNHFNEIFLQTLLDNQYKLKILSNENNCDNNTFLIFDYCFNDNDWLKSNCIYELFMNRRDLKIMSIFVEKCLWNIKPIFRDNIDYIFIFKNTDNETKQKIYDRFLHTNITFDSFNKVIHSMDNCLVIDLNINSDKNEHIFFWY